MRGSDATSGSLFSYVVVEDRIPATHPLRPIRTIVNEVLASLDAELNLNAGRDFTPVCSGKHDNSMLGVANKDYDAAAIANEVMFRMFERKVVDKAKIRTIYKSETFPTTSYGIAHNLDPALAAKVKEAFFTFPWEGSALKAEFKTEDRFVPITYQKDWSVIRKIDAATGVKYSCK
ncbi:MAG: PhnD/SsuA/transferrin family substrate-binding protein [Hyphomicrobiales bacterium]